jgi:integrase
MEWRTTTEVDLLGDAKREHLDKEWLELIKPLLDAKEYDLRRASGLYLGRELGVDPFLLQDHMRHTSMATMLLYTRRPKDEKETADSQNWDDVG